MINPDKTTIQQNISTSLIPTTLLIPATIITPATTDAFAKIPLFDLTLSSAKNSLTSNKLFEPQSRMYSIFSLWSAHYVLYNLWCSTLWVLWP